MSTNRPARSVTASWPSLVRCVHGGVGTVLTVLLFHGGHGLADAVQDVAEHAQEPFGLGTVRLPQRFRLVAAPLVDRGHPLAEHRHHVVADPGPHRVQEANDQSEPLVLIQYLAQAGDVGYSRFAREMRDLPRRDSLQPLLCRAERVQVLQERQACFELAQGCGLRHVLQAVVLAAPGDRIDHQQPGQPGACGRLVPRSKFASSHAP
ncbi:hypothetical protein [Nonomuraea sp. JJY05]|uniref:hypothetical protein n=1 Tax=Nonomuraea sp. JJY05 TaxID=3350255 RepID=UPI00373E3822